MKFVSSRIYAIGLAATLALVSVAPANAAPWMPSENSTVFSDLILEAQYRRIERREDNREIRQDRREDRREDRRDARQDRREDRQEDRFERRRDGVYYRGHRGSSQRRQGYREHNGFWFPPAAFIAGAIIGGALNNQPAVRSPIRLSGAHVQWCSERYRSYRTSDNSFQPYNGPRQSCRSPY